MNENFDATAAKTEETLVRWVGFLSLSRRCAQSFTNFPQKTGKGEKTEIRHQSLTYHSPSTHPRSVDRAIINPSIAQMLGGTHPVDRRRRAAALTNNQCHGMQWWYTYIYSHNHFEIRERNPTRHLVLIPSNLSVSVPTSLWISPHHADRLCPHCSQENRSCGIHQLHRQFSHSHQSTVG